MKRILASVLICSLMFIGFSAMSSSASAQEKGTKNHPVKTVKKDSAKSGKKADKKAEKKDGKKADKDDSKIDLSKLPKADTGEVLALEKKAGSASVPESVKSREIRPRLPRFYGDLELSEDQILKIYAIQKEYLETIITLRYRLERLDDEREALCEKVLTSSQKTKLDAQKPKLKPGDVRKTLRGPNWQKPAQAPAAHKKVK